MKPDYQILLARVESLKKELDALQPLKAEDEARLWRMQRMEWNYQANRFEGNRLTLSQTELLLDHDLSFDSSFREVAEMKAHDTAVELAHEWSKDPNRPLTASDILELHQIVSVRFSPRKSLAPQPGHLSPWNKVGNRFLFARAYQKVRIEDIHKAIALQSNPKPYRDAFSAVISFFYQMLMTKPYDENNVRVPLLTANLMFMRAGYPPISFRLEDKAAYFQAFKEMGGGAIAHPDGFFRFVAQQMVASLEKAIALVKGQELEKPHDVKAEIAAWKDTLNVTRQAPVEKSWEVVKSLYLTEIAGFLENYRKGIAVFEDLYHQSKSKEWVSMDSHYTQELRLFEERVSGQRRNEYAQPLQGSDLQLIGLTHNFVYLKGGKRLPAEVSLLLHCIFGVTALSITFQGLVLLVKEYGTPPTKMEMDQVLETCLKIAFEEIKTKANPKYLNTRNK